jgi:glycosyltransferase involved in cell wall biosynthesis
MAAFVEKLQPPSKPVTWYGRAQRAQLSPAGVVSIPSPKIAEEAWHRRLVGDQSYGICGITHTTATARVSDALAEMLTAPVYPWDALICTSRAVRSSVETQIEVVREYLDERLGVRRKPSVRLETIPLGIDAPAFAQAPERRAGWRAELDIPADAVVALYVGRFNLLSKMNPVAMAIALERAAKRLGKPLYWVLSGWAATDEKAEEFHAVTRAACPSVTYRVVDGRRPETRFSIWSVADFFISLSDNIQETFGLTPVEAMAAGLPSVISDWNGYRDTVRHGADGFRVSTYAPRPGLGADLAFRHSVGWDSYDGYVGATSQFTAIDIEESAQAIFDLASNPDLRRRMGENARRRAAEVFDWSAVIPQYQALWADMAALRPKQRPVRANNSPDNPYRLDPYRLFGGYPTEQLSQHTGLHVTPGITAAEAVAFLSQPILRNVVAILPKQEEVESIIEIVAGHRRATVADVTTAFPLARRIHVERFILTLAKYGLLIVTPTSPLPLNR